MCIRDRANIEFLKDFYKARKENENENEEEVLQDMNIILTWTKTS